MILLKKLNTTLPAGVAPEPVTVALSWTVTPLVEAVMVFSFGSKIAVVTEGVNCVPKLPVMVACPVALLAKLSAMPVEPDRVTVSPIATVGNVGEVVALPLSVMVKTVPLAFQADPPKAPLLSKKECPLFKVN